jgi:hypothetical protein
MHVLLIDLPEYQLFRRLIKIFNFILYIQNGAMNRGLLFAGPPPPPFGVCEQKD